MKCRQAEEVLIELARGVQMDQQKAEEALEHAGQCADCAAHWQEQRQLSYWLQELKHAEPPAVAVSERLRLTETSRPTAALRFARAAVLIAVCVGGWMMVRSNTIATRPSVEPPPAAEAADFIPLAAGDPISNSFYVIRVEFPASALQEFGLPVDPKFGSQKVQADLVVSDSGMPRAIRLISDFQ